jgi:hypothetical protein
LYELQSCHVTLTLNNVPFFRRKELFLVSFAEMEISTLRVLLVLLIFCGWTVVAVLVEDGLSNIWALGNSEKLAPTVVIAVLVRNKAYTLPYFLTALENLNYPKDRISLW